MTFGGYVIYIFNLGVAMGAVLAFVAIAYSGTKLLNSGGNPSAISDAKKRIFNALLGLAVLLLSYVLLTTVNPNLVIIKDIGLGGVTINVPIFSSEKVKEAKPTLIFPEIPIGTVTESILAGNSSTRNGLECYEYDDKTGDPVDKNGDGKITEKDIVLDRDIFYCMKDLETALRKKVETQLPQMIKDQEEAMQSCQCSRVYVEHDPSAEIYSTGGKCGCNACRSFCTVCGHPYVGCPGAPGNNQEGAKELQQYFYDPCPNRKEVDCKGQRIKQMMDGTEPEEICYTAGYISEDDPKYPDILTFKDGISRMTAFKDYFINQVNTLKQLEKDTKSPSGERLTLAEFYTAQNTNEDNVITKSQFGNYDIFRYCDDVCAIKDKSGNCAVEQELNDQLRICRQAGSGEKFLYDGDPLTFYFNSTYNDQQEKDFKEIIKKENYKCSVYDKDNGGVIPIGELVDNTEIYGLKVAEKISDLIEVIQGTYVTAIAISDISETCDSGNCANSNVNCCYQPQCGCKGECCCPGVSYTSCYKAIPTASRYFDFSSYSSGSPLTKSYDGCSTFCGGTPTVRQEEDQRFVCSYGSFCGLVRKIYQIKEIETSCYDKTNDEAEGKLRSFNMGIVGYLQKWEEREKRLYSITEIKSLKEVAPIDSEAAEDVIHSVCRSYFINPNEETLECDSGLSVSDQFESRFSLADKLMTSRKKMNSCITGYSFPYKDNLAKTFVFNCLEGISHQTLDDLVILPEFPYPTAKFQKYQNCYPYNRSDLSVEDRTKCFDNIYTPECRSIVEEYMDNYYCCK